MTIDQLSKNRKNLYQQLIENKAMDGVKELLTVLYSDKVHFVYELLQNAEDAEASEVKFVLNADRLEFEHNGDQLFEIEDVESITNIGSSTKAKANDFTSIGKFGIGFKAVFAYTSTPEIESGPFRFRIRDMFVPDTEGLAPGALGERRTRFVFPFDNPEKSPEKASREIETKFRQLNENTLLFLSNIRKIEYRLPDLTTGFLERRENANDGNRIEISIRHPENIVPEAAHYLRFEKIVSVKDKDKDEHKKCRIAVAYGMDKPEGGDWKIQPLSPGEVCIYFPAVKETSKLRFHLHAPFASTVARDSVRDTPANDELRDHIADLVAESMHSIRDRGLLDVEFLATLPNNTDNLSPFYLPIQEQLTTEFNQKKLVPMKHGGHTPASECYRGPRALSNLINDNDLATLLGKDCSQPLWIANPQQLNQREDNFLSILDISRWNIGNLVTVLDNRSDTVVEWLKGKSDDWHQDLYVLLADFLSSTPSSPLYIARERKEKLSNLCIVRCNDSEYRIGSDCHFIGNDIGDDENWQNDFTILAESDSSESQAEESYEKNFHYVASAVYSSGNNKYQQESAREFLETIGVRKVDDAERVKVILEQRYRKDSIKPREGDMEKFMALVEHQPENISLFKDYFIFEVNLDRGDSKWFRKPNGVFVDSPYLATGLTAYHESLREDSDFFKRAISSNYAESDIDVKKFGEFAEKVGAQTKLTAKEQEIPYDHPEHQYLVNLAEGQWRYNTGIDKDYVIFEFNTLLDVPSIESSRLIWKTMCSVPEYCLQARYRNNRSQLIRSGASSLVHDLRKAKWVPQQDGDSVSFVSPRDASREHLPSQGFPWPKGYPHDAGEAWLNKVEFGKTAKERREEYTQQDQRAKADGFASLEEKENCVEFLRRLREKGKSIEDVMSQYKTSNSETRPDFPISSVKNPELRKERVSEQLENAPEKTYEERPRRERTTKSEMGDHRTLLREWYTNDSGEMVCQICKEEMPFKKLDDEYYFEAVEALTIEFTDDELPKNHFPKEYEAQYLALCPECSARYNYFVREVKDGRKIMEELKHQLMNSDNLEIPVRLGELETDIGFVETHLHELKAALHYYENPQDPEDSDD